MRSLVPVFTFYMFNSIFLSFYIGIFPRIENNSEIRLYGYTDTLCGSNGTALSKILGHSPFKGGATCAHPSPPLPVC